MAQTYESIATTTLSSAAASITFNSIANSWTDLRVVILTPTATGDYIELRFNGSSSGYSWNLMGSDGASAFSQRGTSLTQVRVGVSMGSATYPTYAITDIMSYGNSAYKVVLSKSGGDKNGSGEVRYFAGNWANTSAITSILIKGDSGGNLAANTVATLYGIKAA